MEDKRFRVKVSELRAILREVIEGLRPAEPQAPPIVEFRSFDEDFAEKLTDKKYESMASKLYNAWPERGADVDWLGVVNLYARNHSKNLATEIDRTKLYEAVLSLVEDDHASVKPAEKA